VKPGGGRDGRATITNSTTPYPQKITCGELRASGVRDVLIYCRVHRCHHLKISTNRWANHIRLSY
jgi:hypothetical protein